MKMGAGTLPALLETEIYINFNWRIKDEMVDLNKNNEKAMVANWRVLLIAALVIICSYLIMSADGFPGEVPSVLGEYCWKQISKVKSTHLTNLWSDSAYDSAMLWGSYRPGIYFGMKTRTTAPITTGIMYSSISDLRTLRHQCRHGIHIIFYSKPISQGISHYSLISSQRIKCNDMDGYNTMESITENMKF
jgi:hypothetical protein